MELVHHETIIIFTIARVKVVRPLLSMKSVQTCMWFSRTRKIFDYNSQHFTAAKTGSSVLYDTPKYISKSNNNSFYGNNINCFKKKLPQERNHWMTVNLRSMCDMWMDMYRPKFYYCKASFCTYYLYRVFH